MFGSIDELLDHLMTEDPVQRVYATERVPYGYVHADDDFSKVNIVPSVYLPCLYRGQNSRHAPCWPSAWRNPPRLKDGAIDESYWVLKYKLSRIRIAEFELLMKSHPFGKLAGRLSMKTNYDALAQHYELPTDWLDLTGSLRVAAFFATCWRGEDGIWHPCDRGVGCFYRVRRHELPPPTSSLLPCIAYQAGRRPKAQHAFAVRLRREQDFETVGVVDRFEFTHDGAASARLLQDLAGGNDLYPTDCVAEIADRLKPRWQPDGCTYAGLPIVTMRGVRHALERDGCPEERRDSIATRTAEELAQWVGLDVRVDDHFELTDAQVADGQAQVDEFEQFLRAGVGLRLVRVRRNVPP